MCMYMFLYHCGVQGGWVSEALRAVEPTRPLWSVRPKPPGTVVQYSIERHGPDKAHIITLHNPVITLGPSHLSRAFAVSGTRDVSGQNGWERRVGKPTEGTSKGAVFRSEGDVTTCGADRPLLKTM